MRTDSNFFKMIQKYSLYFIGNEKYVNRQMDSEYEALMAELGTGKPKGPLGQDPQKSRTENLASQPAQNINRVSGYHIRKRTDLRT